MIAGLAGTPRYFAWLYGGERMQSILMPLFGIEAEISTALQPGLEHNVAHVRTTWWAEEAQRVRGGHALHPLTRALLAQRPPAARGGPDISGLVDITTWDLAAATFETRAELSGYCERWACALPLVAASLANPELQAHTLEQFALGLGVALCELEMLVSLKQAARLGRLRMPLDELASLGVAPDTLGQTPWPAALSERLKVRHQQLRATLQEKCRQLIVPPQRAALRGLLVWAAVMQQHSQRAERALPNIWQRSRWDGISDALHAWRAARRAMV